MHKSAAVTAAAFVLGACSNLPLLAPPPPVVAVVKAEQKFPPRPLTLLYTTFQDHAVLQRDRTIPVWGRTTPGAAVTVTLAGQTATATADDKGEWKTDLAAMKAGGPYVLAATSSSGETQTVSDIMLGDVYLCSGQSNMELPLRLATNYDSELRSAKNPLLRLFHVQRATSPMPHKVFGSDASWSMTTPDTAKEFSATCYYFGANLQPAAGVALGLIEDAWGGSTIQAWISNEKIATLGNYNDVLGIVKAYAADAKEGDRQYRALMRKLLETHDPGMNARWFDPAFDDTTWATCTASGGWRVCPAMGNNDGIAWVRKTITLTADEAAGAATLNLGQISNQDVTFVNGVEVGSNEGYDVPRTYPLANGLLHEGKNVIAIATVTGGGLLDASDKMGLKLANGTIKPLSGSWTWAPSLAANKTPLVPHQPWRNQFGLSTLYNGMILPLGSTPVKAIVWYQGETDADQPAEYRRLLHALIDDWRGRFGADTPFFAVQLPGYGAQRNAPGKSLWAETRESQRVVIEETAHAGLAVTTDLGVPDNIHPQMKQEVGRRLALLAKQQIYRLPVEGISPRPVKAIRNANTITVHFDHVGTGLTAREWNKPVGFSLCTPDRTCHWVDGTLTKDSVALSVPKAAANASFVRFCWADSPLCNVYSAEGLPAVPFEIPVSTAK